MFTETIRTIRVGVPRTATSTFTQLLSSDGGTLLEQSAFITVVWYPVPALSSKGFGATFDHGHIAA